MANVFQSIRKLLRLISEAAVLREKFLIIRERCKNDAEIVGFIDEAVKLFDEVKEIRL